MGLKGQSNLDTANTSAKVIFDEVFNAASPAPGVFNLLASTYSTGTESDELVFTTFLNTVREWLGSREYGNFEAFRQAVRLTTYEDSWALPRRRVDYDKSGSIGKALAQKIRQARANSDDKIIFDKLVSASGDGPTGFDGSALFATAHTLGSSTYGNKTTSALSFSTFDTARQTMQGYKAANGEPLNVNPTHLIVGPKLEKMARQVAEADERIVAVDNAGDETGTRVAAAGIPNVFRGTVDVVIWNRLTGSQDDYWYLVDASQPEKPMLLKSERDWELLEMTQMTDPLRFGKDMYAWGIEADKAAAAGAWPCIYGGIL